MRQFFASAARSSMPTPPLERGGEPGMRDQRGVLVEHLLGRDARLGDEVGILHHAQQPQRRPRAGLRVAEHVALAAQLEVDLGELEAVERRRDGLDALARAGVPGAAPR